MIGFRTQIAALTRELEEAAAAHALAPEPEKSARGAALVSARKNLQHFFATCLPDDWRGEERAT